MKAETDSDIVWLGFDIAGTALAHLSQFPSLTKLTKHARVWMFVLQSVFPNERLGFKQSYKRRVCITCLWSVRNMNYKI